MALFTGIVIHLLVLFYLISSLLLRPLSSTDFVSVITYL